MTGTRGAVWSVIISLQIKITSLLLAKASILTSLNYSSVAVIGTLLKRNFIWKPTYSSGELVGIRTGNMAMREFGLNK
jgi:hypothetical protein